MALTPFQVWVSLKGLSVIQAASLAAAIGDPANYSHAGQVFRRSGLVSGRNDSGTRQRKGQGNPILKIGAVYLRRALMNAVTTLILHQPVLGRYYRRLRRSKSTGVARLAHAIPRRVRAVRGPADHALEARPRPKAWTALEPCH